MSWFNRLPLNQKITAACYLVAALFAIPTLIAFILVGKIVVGISVIAVLAALTYPFTRYLQTALTSSFDDISNASAKIAKGDFTSRIMESGGMVNLNRSFNSMVDKLRKIL
ncbi:MAG TPA: methyl-accepting chemotaxis protein, partial [Paenibacillus sp.]